MPDALLRAAPRGGVPSARQPAGWPGDPALPAVAAPSWRSGDAQAPRTPPAAAALRPGAPRAAAAGARAPRCTSALGAALRGGANSPCKACP
jgi:hypothetical protein